MTTVNNNKRLLDIPTWEPTNTTFISSNAVFIPSYHVRQMVWYVDASTNFGPRLYFPEVDGDVRAPGSFSTGGSMAGYATAWSTGSTLGVSSLAATAGTTSTITTSLTLNRDLRGWPIHIMSGPNAGVTLTISKNTIGANSVITVPTQASAFDNTTTYRLGTPRFWMMVGPNGTVSFNVYDWATDTNTTPSVVGVPSYSNGSTLALTGVPSWVDTDYHAFATGTATSGGSTTISNSAKSWATNQWTSYQIRIVSGTGAGQIRTIASNTSTQITVGTAWTITPDSTSIYSIEGNDDFIYLIGTSSTAVYRYSVSSNTWTTLTAAVARGANNGIGGAACIPFRVTDSDWTNESSIINGRRLYATKGTSVSGLDYYDIPSNSWVAPTIGNTSTLTSTGSGIRFAMGRDKFYCNSTSYDVNANPARWVCFDFVKNQLEPFPAFLPISLNANNSSSNLSFFAYYKDGSNYVDYVYTLLPPGAGTGIPFQTLYRCLVV